MILPLPEITDVSRSTNLRRPRFFGIHHRIESGRVQSASALSLSRMPPRLRLPPTGFSLNLGAYHKLIYYNQVDRGGHYAAWEQPKLFSEEVRAGFRPLR
jgi:hypothetical protein